MREIRFRGKRLDSDEQEFVFGYYYVINGAMPNSGDRHIIVSKGTGTGQSTLHIPVLEKTVGQFTGLTDKNCVEIFEGDILDCFDRVVRVEWNNPNGTWDSIFIKYTEKELMSNGVLPVEWKFKATVIGNIHEVAE